MNGFRVPMRGRVRDQRGSSSVELAFALPLLVAIVVGTVDFARVFYWDMALTSAARAGAQWGAQNTTNAVNTTTMRTTALASASADIPSLLLTDITASCQLQCAPDAPNVPDFNSGVPTPSASCGAVNPSCTSGHLTWKVSVTVSKTFTTRARYPGIPSSIAIARTVTMRAQ
jgi:Flp pilus assembly protein TadG